MMPTFHSPQAWIAPDQYQKLYEHSIQNPEAFWAEQAQQFLTWFKPWDTVYSGALANGDVRWFEGGQLNVSYNCLDRHLATRANQIALIWQGDADNEVKQFTYQEVFNEVCCFSNVLKNYQVKKGDRVCIYLPMIPEALFVMLACARIGAVHSVVFGGFSPEALRGRIIDAKCKLVITADHGFRGGKKIPLKQNVDEALNSECHVEHVIVVNRSGDTINWQEPRDVWYHEAMANVNSICQAEIMESEDPLFILYTSGSTGKPKGVLHTTAGYLLYAAITHQYVFDYHEGDIYWCTADVGWITGHSYLVYGPLANGATTIMFEGIPTYPDASRFWKIVDKFKVNQFYTAPTALRSLMGAGDQFLANTKRASLKVLGSVGEPINPEVWEWYFNSVGKKNCPIVDTWWQTETGGHMITPLPYASKLVPGAATKAFFGISPAILDEQNTIIEGVGEGRLVITQAWPAIARTVYGDHQRYLETYLQVCPGYYFTGDGARRDADGNYWITGRVDDAINVSGHLLGTAEIESALILHDEVAEAAVVGYPHHLKGQGIYAYVTLMQGVTPTDALKQALIKLVRQQIGPIATPDVIQWAPGLPKTRSGKIMRRILRKIAAGEIEQLGDTSTLADPEVVQQLISNRGG